MNNIQHKPVLPPLALYGLAGDIVKAIFPHTEADQAALLAQVITCFGNVIGRTAHFSAEASKHYTNLYVLIVGVSGKGRKGSSLNQIKQLFDIPDLSDWNQNCLAKGLSSGEGLIERVKDVVRMDVQDIQILENTDKRLLCVETEFGNVLQVMKRTGNTLSVVLRDAWDGGKLSTLTRNSPLAATNPQISFIGHITFEELKTSINPVDIKNGLGNRFIFFCSDRSKELPEGSKLNAATLRDLQERIGIAFKFVKNLGDIEIPFSEEARKLWVEIYSSLSSQRIGIHGDLCGRAEAQVRRVALVLSLMNGEKEISLAALSAAREIWNYSSESIKYIWGKDFGHPILDKIIAILENCGDEGRSRSELIKDCHNNYSIGRHLDYLVEAGLIFALKKKGNKAKPVTYYYLTQYKKNYELNEV